MSNPLENATPQQAPRFFSEMLMQFPDPDAHIPALDKEENILANMKLRHNEQRQRLFARHQAELAALDADQEKSIDVESSTFLPTNPTRLKTVLHPLQVDHLESVKAQAEIGSAPLERLPSEFRTVLVDLDQFSSATDNDDKLSLLELGIHLGRERTDFLKKLKDEEQELRLFQQEEREPIQRHISRKHDAAKVEEIDPRTGTTWGKRVIKLPKRRATVGLPPVDTRQPPSIKPILKSATTPSQRPQLPSRPSVAFNLPERHSANLPLRPVIDASADPRMQSSSSLTASSSHTRSHNQTPSSRGVQIRERRLSDSMDMREDDPEPKPGPSRRPSWAESPMDVYGRRPERELLQRQELEENWIHPSRQAILGIAPPRGPRTPIERPQERPDERFHDFRDQHRGRGAYRGPYRGAYRGSRGGRGGKGGRGDHHSSNNRDRDRDHR